jgi:hypothetical protein
VPLPQSSRRRNPGRKWGFRRHQGRLPTVFVRSSIDNNPIRQRIEFSAINQHPIPDGIMLSSTDQRPIRPGSSPRQPTTSQSVTESCSCMLTKARSVTESCSCTWTNTRSATGSPCRHATSVNCHPGIYVAQTTTTPSLHATFRGSHYGVGMFPGSGEAESSASLSLRKSKKINRAKPFPARPNAVSTSRFCSHKASTTTLRAFTSF